MLLNPMFFLEIKVVQITRQFELKKKNTSGHGGLLVGYQLVYPFKNNPKRMFGKHK